MKLICWFILVLVITSLNLRAQSFTLSEPDGSGINDGDTILVSGTEAELSLTASVWLMNNSSSSKIVKVRRTELSLATGSVNAFTWAQLQYSPIINVSQGSEIGSTVTDTSFLSFYYPGGLTGISFIQYSFFDENNPADSAWVVVKYEVLQISGIAEINSSFISVFPNPVHEAATIVSSVVDFGVIPVRIRNSLGAVVYVGFLEHGKLSFDASGLPFGYYTIEAGNVIWKLMKQ